jgi:hypothetical protein
MSISPQKNSITKSIGLSNGIKTSPNNKAETKAGGQIAKSTEATNTTDDANVAKEEATTWEPGKPVSKDADKAAADTTKRLWSGYWDFKKSELDHQRGLQQDQLDFQKQLAAQQMAQQNSQIGAGIAAQGIGALGQMISALGQTKGGGGSSGGSSGSGGSGAKPEEELAQNKKGFEDQDKITRVDSKGNPIVDDLNKATGTEGIVQQQGQSHDTQHRPITHQEFQSIDATAQSYDSDNGISIGSHQEMRGNQEEDISLSIAHSDEAQTPEPEIQYEEIA